MLGTPGRGPPGQVSETDRIALDRRPLFAASLYEHKIKYDKPQCKCADVASHRHPMWRLSFSDQGR